MGLYDRDYVRNSARNRDLGYEEERYVEHSDLSTFISKTYQLFAASLIAGAAGGYIGVGVADFVAANYWFIAIPWMLFGMFGISMVIHKPGINYIALFAFTLVSGIIIGPLLNRFLGMSNGPELIANAFISTSVIFGALSIYAMNSKSDFSSWGKPLMIAFFIVIIASLINAFFLHSPMMHVVILGIFMLIISAMVLYDTQNIINGAYSSPIEGALALFLDFFNMFVTLLQIFGIMGDD